jgi:hypothetical protein
MTNGQMTAFERLVRPLSQSLSVELARALIDVQADAETQSRYDELADKRAEGQMVAAELAELEALVRTNTFLGVFKTEARALLARVKPS